MFIFGMLFFFTRAASAEDDSGQPLTDEDRNRQAESVINDAIEMFQSGAYSAAIEKFEQAYELIEDPNILFNIARCYQELGKKEEAVSYYGRFINHPDVPEESKSAAQDRLNQLEAKNQDGAYTGAGDDAASTDDSSYSAGGETDDVQLTPPYSRSRARVLEWTLLGTGAALTVAGAVFGGIAIAKHSEFESSHDRDEKEDLENSGKIMSLTSDITLGVGITAMTTGLILLLVRKPKEKKDSLTSSIIPSARPDGAELSWVVRF
jgi:tetratricopeptide (TPR) repeat protein